MESTVQAEATKLTTIAMSKAQNSGGRRVPTTSASRVLLEAAAIMVVRISPAQPLANPSTIKPRGPMGAVPSALITKAGGVICVRPYPIPPSATIRVKPTNTTKAITSNSSAAPTGNPALFNHKTA